eukprot:CAMPEP_0195288722 /NCGR_PEP_ID=MMETSP0707-20130614/5275_1 /TAXON_ID=33640 /ORGANISM="Asterionellopsis glacialis, Strain CCMP134" /LENGTH=226 /DNA_ID=CAMNT_0040348621 /DNA_START=258 /DNA_END=938 /DNA_ORIENTATION=-
MCYPYSCSNWYRYGPPEYTGHNGTSSVHVDANLWETEELPSHIRRRRPDSRSTVDELTCREQDLPEYLASVGVVYGCTGILGSPPDPVQGMDLYQKFTRSCVARNGPNQFHCYEMSLDTDYTSLRKDAETARTQGMINCSKYNDTTEHFVYQVYLDLKSIGSVSTGSSSDSFDQNLAQTSLYSYLDIITTDECSSAPAIIIMDVSTSCWQKIWMCIVFSAVGVIFM